MATRDLFLGYAVDREPLAGADPVADLSDARFVPIISAFSSAIFIALLALWVVVH